LILSIPQDKFAFLPSNLQNLVKEHFEYLEAGFVIGADGLDLILGFNTLADLCRDMALVFESMDLYLANDCMQQAAQYRQSGPFIQKKLKDYQQLIEVLNSGKTVIQNLNFSFGEKPPFELLKALAEGYYEKDEVRLLKAFLQPEDIVLELGSGIGFMGCVAQTFIKCKQYVAFEANPSLIDIICQNMQQNNVLFDIRNAVLMDENHDVDFYITPAFWASSLIKPSSGEYSKVTVPALDKNEVINSIKPTALIVDIEGGEVEFFKALDLTSVRKIILEIHPLVLSDLDLSALYHSLFNLGFNLDFKESTKVVNYWYR
jgi:FkbM family methyltransferase